MSKNHPNEEKKGKNNTDPIYHACQKIIQKRKRMGKIIQTPFQVLKLHFNTAQTNYHAMLQEGHNQHLYFTRKDEVE